MLLASLSYTSIDAGDVDERGRSQTDELRHGAHEAATASKEARENDRRGPRHVDVHHRAEADSRERVADDVASQRCQDEAHAHGQVKHHGHAEDHGLVDVEQVGEQAQLGDGAGVVATAGNERGLVAVDNRATVVERTHAARPDHQRLPLALYNSEEGQ